MSTPFRFTNARQRRIHERLRLVGPGPAAFFLDACRLIATTELDTTTHMVAHALREIESSLRDVLEPLAAQAKRKTKSKSGDEKHRDEIRTILAALGISETEDIAEAWLRLPGKDSAYGLHRRAHRSALAAPRRIDQEFLAFWNEFNAILEVILDRFAAKYLDSHRILDDLLKVQTPTEGHADRLRNSVPNNLTAFGHFFEQLSNPAWLMPLQAKGLFNDPAPPEVDADAGTIRHPVWPQSRYLSRMAVLDAEGVKDTVFAIARNIDDGGNASIQEDLIVIALALPAAQATSFALRAAQWSESPFPLMLEKLGEFVAHLALGGKSAEAFTLASAIFVPDENNKRDSRFRYWRYDKALKQALKGLTRVAAYQTLTWLLDVLDRTLSQTVGGTDRKQEDSSRSWRPTVKDYKEQRDDDLKDILTTALRDTAQTVLDAGAAEPVVIIESLESADWGICRRIALHLLTSPAAPQELVTARLLDRGNFHNHNIEFEYTSLLHERFGRLTGEEQDVLLQEITNGPPYMENARANHKEWFKRELTGDEETQLVEQWQRDRLAPIKDSLNAMWKERYERLVAEVGEPQDLEDTIRDGVRWVSSASPKTDDELSAISPEELIDFLRNWTPPPPSGYLEPRATRNGLANVLRKRLITDPAPHSAVAEKYIGLHPTYVEALLQSLGEAARQNRKFSWEPVLRLMIWVIAQQDQKEEADSASAQNWKASREAIPGLLDNGLEQGTNELPFSTRQDVWQILDKLSNDPDPTTRRETERNDPVAVAINSVRGRTLHSALRYGVWVQRHIDTDVRTFNDLPELRFVLERHLDDRLDPSPAIRSVYGERFPLLHYLDSAWAETHALQIFPAHGNDVLRDAAWNAYLSSNPAYSQPANVLLAHYDTAIDSLENAEDERDDPQDLEKRLAEHVFVLYAANASPDSHERLRRFYTKASTGLKAHIMHVAGDTLDKQNRSDEWHKRSLDLWQERKTAALLTPEEHAEEIARFGNWFGSKALDDAWALNELSDAITIARRVDPDFVVTKRLADLAPKHPLETLTCLRLMIDGEREQWSIYSWRDDMRAILAAALASANSHEAARELINRLATMNHLEFADLLNASPEMLKQQKVTEA